MAGSYPDMPGPRLYWNMDGSEAYREALPSHVLTQITTDEATGLNDESDSDGVAITAAERLVVIFAAPVDLEGYTFIGTGLTGTPSIEVSGDTTNGVDGTWVAYDATADDQGFDNFGWRKSTAVTASAVKAARISGVGTVEKLYFYGAFTTAGDRLQFWDPGLAQPLAADGLDFADAARLATVTKTFRIRNASAAFTAQGVAISASQLYDAVSPSLASQMLFSTASLDPTPRLVIGDLGPGATSVVITATLNVAANASPGARRAVVKAEATGWV